jgi:hypothetical protein
MKRIITIILFLLVLLVLGLIILNKLEQTKIPNSNNYLDKNITDKNLKLIKNFDLTNFNTEFEPFEGNPTTSITNTIVRIDGTSGDNQDEGLIHSINVDTVRDKFYMIPNVSRGNEEEACRNMTPCSDDSGCDREQECIDLNNHGEKCYNVLNKTAYELEPEKKGYIRIKNNTPNINFNFSFGFILKEAENEKVLISSKSNLWSLKNINQNIHLVVHGESSSEDTELKINNHHISCYKYYLITINVTDKLLKVKFDDQPNSMELFLKPKKCDLDRDCVNGSCTGRQNNKSCTINNDEYYIGKMNNTFINMFVGELKINDIDVETGNSCNFYGQNFKNQRICHESCINSNCDEETCNRECGKVPICEFETIGRHSIDCLKECIKNNDCTSDHCKEKCEECTPNCPWNKNGSNLDTLEFDSQYFDPDGKPSPLKLILNTISTDGTKVEVSWRKPYEGRLYINGFISYLYKTFDKSEGVKINKINVDNACDKSSESTKKCRYLITELTPNETYTLGVKSYNAVGLSKMSNLITFKASVVNINMDLRIEEEVDDYDVGDFNYCNVEN